jgi:cysteinyl-tRNA synthetase
MAVRFHNTLTQRLEAFQPRQEGRVSMYVCGITPYDRAHAGHARVYVVFDVLARHLRARGFEVNYTRNVTDVDDNILKRSRAAGQEPLLFSSTMWAAAEKDLFAIGCGKPDHEPRVSTHIPEIVALIEAIIAAGHAYVVDAAHGKDVYFEVRSFSPYGKLSHRNIDDLLAGARVDPNEIKRDPLDFALWKGCDESEWGFASPWGKGRPGWHIECSAMAAKYLGEHFDIHCGGMDLIFPHHENEVAQSESVWGPDFARYWLHNGFLNVDSEKMSKSLGNFVTIQDVLQRNDAEALRYFLLGTHYRGPLAFDMTKRGDDRVVFPGVDEAERRVDYLYTTLESLRLSAKGASPGDGPPALKAQQKVVAEAREAVLTALDKDIGTPQALAVLADLAKAGNEIATFAKKKKDASAGALAAAAAEALSASCDVLGLLQSPVETFFARTRAQRLAIRGLDASDLDAKVKARDAARAAKDFARADTIRSELTAMGVDVLDGEAGSVWRLPV